MCRGSDTPTIYVGILICISPIEKKHSNCMQQVLRCWERQSDDSAGATPWTPLRELTALPQTPKLVGRGWLPPPQELHPRSRPFGPRLSYPHSKSSPDAVGSVPSPFSSPLEISACFESDGFLFHFCLFYGCNYTDS